MSRITNYKKYQPKLNDWFDSEITYEGKATATFEEPKGVVFGKAKVTINQFGQITAEMKSEGIKTKKKIGGKNSSTKILQFLYRSIKTLGATLVMSDSNKNLCSQLSIKTRDGIFISKGLINWSTIDPDDRVIFWFSRGLFTSRQQRKAEYWVVPLINFISDFPTINNHPKLVNHPLRLFSTPKIPKSEKNKASAFYYANQRNHLIGFNFSKTFGYIELLPDYSKKKKELESEEKRKHLTALMIGGISDLINDYWFPHDYAKLLTVATGSEVQAAWLEYRDAKGKLVSREHFPSLNVCYTKGYGVTKDNIGKLISLASNFVEFNNTYFGVFTNQLTHLITTYHFENRMMILTRAFEGLYEYLNKEETLHSKNLMTKLPDSIKNEVNQIIHDTQKNIRKLSRRARSEGVSEEICYSLERIANRINANNKDDDFGTKVIKILDWYELPDSKIMSKYYHEKKNKSWAGYLSQIRNNPIHDGYFSLQDGKHNSDEIINFQDHLHDILIRIFLKILDYNEDYNPKVKDRYVAQKANWVTEKTSAIDLGYGRVRGLD